MNIPSLQELCATHSVTGDTQNVIRLLAAKLKKRGISSEISSYGVLLFGNRKNPKVLVSAHADEIGFMVSKKNDDGTFLVNKSGIVGPTQLNNSHVYVETHKGKIYGFFYPKLELGSNNPESFQETFLDTIDNNAVQVGDFGSYMRVFEKNKEKVIATGLDNKAGVELVLELVEENPELLKSTLFSFVTEEEASYDCIAGVAHRFSPEYAMVVDMFPVNHISKGKVEQMAVLGKGPAVLLGMGGAYHLHETIRKKLDSVKVSYQTAIVDIPFPPEPQILQRNGITKGMNIFIPMLGWHDGAYTMNINDFEQSKKFTLAMHRTLIK